MERRSTWRGAVVAVGSLAAMMASCGPMIRNSSDCGQLKDASEADKCRKCIDEEGGHYALHACQNTKADRERNAAQSAESEKRRAQQRMKRLNELAPQYIQAGYMTPERQGAVRGNANCKEVHRCDRGDCRCYEGPNTNLECCDPDLEQCRKHAINCKKLCYYCR